MSSIGNQLKEARSKKTLSLDDVYSRIKIHPRVLNLLEEGRFEKLPSPLFVKSFLKSYAEFLELSPENIIQAYEKEDQKDPEQVLFIKPVDAKPAASTPKNLLPGLVAICLIAAVGFCSFYLVKASTHFFKKKTSIRASQKIPVQETKKIEWLRSVERGDYPTISSKTPLELKIHATDNVWLHITCDGKVLFQSILKRGSSESWSANKSIEVWTGNASSMNLVLNRLDLGSPGKGAVKKIILTREGARPGA